jgi:hypothetical protein
MENLMNDTAPIVPQDVARWLEVAKVEQELRQKYAAELKAASWWKAFLLRMRIKREAGLLLRQRRMAVLQDPSRTKL